MSAAQAGQGTGGDAAQTNGGEAAAPAFDAAALQSQLQATAGGVDQLRQQFGQFLEAAPWQQQEASQEAEPGIDLSFLDEGLYTDPAIGQQDREAMQAQFGQQVTSLAQQIAQQQVAPVQERLADMQREQEIRDLVAEHPEFQDEQVATQVVGLARQIAEAKGTPELGHQPWFWKIIHQANRATQAANAEQGTQDQQAATLEGGGGSGPAAAQANAGQQRADALFNARKGASVLPW